MLADAAACGIVGAYFCCKTSWTQQADDVIPIIFRLRKSQAPSPSFRTAHFQNLCKHPDFRYSFHEYTRVARFERRLQGLSIALRQ
jgi:hypothetical protein